MMRIIDVFELIKKHEGFRAKPYRCTAGKLTIGYGRNLEDSGVSEYEAECMFANDVAKLSSELWRKLEQFGYQELNLNRRSVMISMAYQMGVSGLLKFPRMLEAVRQKDFETAAFEMLDSKWAKQTPARAQELAGIMRKGE